MDSIQYLLFVCWHSHGNRGDYNHCCRKISSPVGGKRLLPDSSWLRIFTLRLLSVSCVDDLGFSYKYPMCHCTMARNSFEVQLERVKMLFTICTDQISVQIVVNGSFPPVQWRNYRKFKCFQDSVAYFCTQIVLLMYLWWDSIGWIENLFWKIKTRKRKLRQRCLAWINNEESARPLVCLLTLYSWCHWDSNGRKWPDNRLFYLSILKEFHVMEIMSCNLEKRTFKHLDLLFEAAVGLPAAFLL